MKLREALQSTRLLVLVTVAAATLALAMMGALSKAGLDRIGSYEDREMEYGMSMLRGAYQLKAAVTQQSAALRGFLLTGERNLLAPRDQGITEFTVALNTLRQREIDDVDQVAIAELQRRHVAYRDEADRLLATWRPRSSAGQWMTAIESLNQKRDPLLESVEAFILKQETDMAVLHREVDEAEASTLNLLTGTGLSAIFLIGLLGSALVQRVVPPLGDLKVAAEALGAGELHRRVMPRRPDEFGDVAMSFNHMAGRIETLVQDQQAAHEELEAQSEALREQAEELQAQEEELQAQNEEMRSQHDHLEAANHALEEANRYKDEFLSVVSHELRTPLTSTVGYTEFLEDGLGGPLSPEQERFVRQIKVGLHRVEHLVDDLLEFARLKAGTFRLRKSPADLRGTVIEVVEGLRPQAEDAQLTLETFFEELPEAVLMDPERIGQVLTNLLGNAIKFTPAGGTIRVSAHATGTRLMCQVEDNGRGISQEDMDRLFQRFSQLEQGLQKGGTGLGLSISKALIEAHGGQIGVRSHPGQGSTFWFTLPVSSAASEAEASHSPQQTA